MQEIDLNLLPVLHALLREENVTRAAAQLHLSVPATSRALERCRRTFDDPLLVRRGRGVVTTPRARELLARLQPLLADVGSLVARPAPFQAAQLRQRFAVRANEAVLAALGSALLTIVATEAPHVELRFESEAADDLDAVGNGGAALAIGSYGNLPGELRRAHLADERLVGVLRAGHPAAGRRLTVRAFADLDHVVTSRRGVARGPVDRHLAERGLERRIVAVVPSFAAALAMTAQSDLTALAPRRLAALLAGPAGLTIYAPPVPLPVVNVLQVWHGRNDADPAHGWLRSCVARAAAAAA